ncbi:PAS domain S-box protein [Chryseolinea sp. T2]|uniref:PAS domain S-box protein n=1 Tax=Chryseolinea sp. T2 TaxID=3129255 RepID=UPI00307865DE
MSGVFYTTTSQDKRNVIMTNNLSLSLVAMLAVLMTARIVLLTADPVLITRLAFGMILCLIPILLNYFGYIWASRFLLSWIPPVLILALFVLAVKQGRENEVSAYIGLRFFLLAFSYYPFLVFSLGNVKQLIAGLTVPFFTILFFDPILDFFGVGYPEQTLNSFPYMYNTVRAIVSFGIIGSGCYFLKRAFERSEDANTNLLKEVEAMNVMMQQQAKSEVHQLNQQLYANLQQLSEREFILSQSQRIARIGSWEYHVADNFVFWSDEMYAIFGLDKESFELKVSNLSEALGNEGAVHVSQATAELLKTGSPFDITIRTRTPIGYKKWFRVNAFPILESEKIVGARGICHDITFFKEAEEKLRSSEAKFAKVFESYPDMILVVREVDQIVFDVNQRIIEVLGYHEHEVVGLPLHSLKTFMTEDVRQFFIQANDAIGYAEKECVLKRKDGATIMVRVTGTRISIEDKYYRMSIVQDITEQKRTEQEKEAARDSFLSSQANLRATINNTELLIWSVDRDFNLITFNIPFAKYMLHHYELELAIGDAVLEGTRATEGAEVAKMWNSHYTRALAGEIVTLYDTRHGQDIQYSLSPIIEDNQVIGVSVFGDNVTESRTKDRQLAEANKKIGELKLMALRSAMSPHFIFNVLNSIQYFIAKNDRLNAITYLTTFSKLIRSILTHSVDNRIKLSDEIELLKNYVQLEMVRFENKFSFECTVDQSLETEAIYIPSLLIQPYLENAILHGLYNKIGRGTLKLAIFEKGDAVIFEIEDDGIGRAAATALRQQNFPAHKSMGIKLTEERLQLINQKNNVGFEVEDLFSNGEPAGTRVRIQVIC